LTKVSSLLKVTYAYDDENRLQWVWDYRFAKDQGTAKQSSRR